MNSTARHQHSSCSYNCSNTTGYHYYCYYYYYYYYFIHFCSTQKKNL